MTEEEKQQVIELWEQGWSGGKIGEKFNFTRCSVIGFISRQRRNGYVFKRPIEKWHSIRKSTPRSEVVKMKKEKKPVVKKEKVKRTPKPKAAPIKVTLDKEPFPLRDYSTNLMGLTRLSCRYPISPDDAPEMIFCGKPQEHGSYCREHGAICYYPSKHQTPSAQTSE